MTLEFRGLNRIYSRRKVVAEINRLWTTKQSTHAQSLLSDFWALSQPIQQACQCSAPGTMYHGFVLVLGFSKSDLFSCIRLVSVCTSLPLIQEGSFNQFRPGYTSLPKIPAHPKTITHLGIFFWDSRSFWNILYLPPVSQWPWIFHMPLAYGTCVYVPTFPRPVICHMKYLSSQGCLVPALPSCEYKAGERGHLSSYSAWVTCFVPNFHSVGWFVFIPHSEDFVMGLIFCPGGGYPAQTSSTVE